MADQLGADRSLGGRDRMRFRRGLSGEFVAELKSGRFRELLRVTKGRRLDLQIRESYLDVYAEGRRVLGLAESRRRPGTYQASVHEKYLCGVELPCRRSNAGHYARFEASDDFTSAYLSSLDLILGNACRYRRPEGLLEERLIRCSLGDDSPVMFIDRQVQLHDVRSRADLIGVMTPSHAGAKVVLVELKQGLDNRIQDLACQMGCYREAFAPGGYLAADVAASYRQVVTQKRELGVLPASARFPEDNSPVDCLLVLADYNHDSRLLCRLRERAQGSGIKLVLLEPQTSVLPPLGSWEVL